MRPLVAFLIVLAMFVAPRSHAGEVPRVVIALYEEAGEDIVKRTRIHRFAEMPLNHLGLVVEYHDTSTGLPDLSRRSDVRGIITWFSGAPFNEPQVYADWLTAAASRGIKLAVFGRTGLDQRADGTDAPDSLADRLWRLFGLRDESYWVGDTHRSRVVHADDMIGYERALTGWLPAYPRLRRVDPRADARLVLRDGTSTDTESALVVTSPAGGFAAGDYAARYFADQKRGQWIIDPFEFFRIVFQTDDLPKPDVTTLSGRRIYFSHIDGDGWRNQTEVPPLNEAREISAEVVRVRAILPRPDLPVAVAPIVSDIDPKMSGTLQALETARLLFALPQVEASSHTWTHPFRWSFFENYTPESERVFLDRSTKIRRGLIAMLSGRETDPYATTEGNEGGEEGDIGEYAVPRPFMREPFDLEREINGALDYFTRLAPPDAPPARLVQWSGDTTPFPAAVAAARRTGAVNMNGGDSRFDPRYPSVSSVPPIGVPVGDQRQIYAAASNENTFTELWSERFHGYRASLITARNTGRPRRLKPFNVYYHMYSGQKPASLAALLDVLDAARAAETTPIRASRYAAIADGFYSTRLIADGPNVFRVHDRGALQTLRFDRATFRGVDHTRSRGVIGARHQGGSLYVALDPAVSEPIVALVDIDRADIEPASDRPYLIHSRWVLSEVRATPDRVEATVEGFGAGEMVWRLPKPASARIVLTARDGTEIGRAEGVADAVTLEARFVLPPIDPRRPARVALTLGGL